VALLLMSAAMMFGAAVGVRNEAHFGFFLLVQTLLRRRSGRCSSVSPG